MTDRRHGLSRPAGIDGVPHSRFEHGRFGRLFRNLDPAEFETTALKKLAGIMVDPDEAAKQPGWKPEKPDPSKGDNPNIPAGYTYLGQFIDHDLTFDPASSLLRFTDPDALNNFRTPRFDLDSLYGEGPDDEPFLYDVEADRATMLLGAIAPAADGEGSPGPDLPRNSQGTALIGDPRNDENAIVAQLQLAFLQAHNKLVGLVEDFQEARRQLRWHYQYVVVNDFLRRIVPADVLTDLLPTGDDWCEVCHCRFGHGLPFMPVEFSVAAYRFGHSMIRPRYGVNGEVSKPIFVGPEGGKGGDLRGFRPLTKELKIDWALFFEIGGQPPQGSRLIDTRLADGLASLPSTDPPSLAFRNLQRGVALGLPCGEAVAKALGITPLGPGQVDLGQLGLDEPSQKEFKDRTPLWFYVLREAAVTQSGERLGNVGGWIVAQTLLCLLAADQFSYVNIEPGWNPAKAGLIPHDGDFEMADLIRFATS